MKKSIYLHTCIYIVCISLANIVNAQFTFQLPGMQAPNATTTPPDSALLPNINDRVEKLRAAGVEEDVIQAYIKQNQPQTQPPTNQNTIPGIKPAAKPENDSLSNSLLTVTPPNGSNYANIDTVAYKEKIRKELLFTEAKRKQREYEEALNSAGVVFGHHMFLKDDPTRADSASFAPPEDYIVQAGDQFNVQVFGPAELIDVLPVEKDGSIFRQYIGKRFLAGLTYRDAKKVLESAYRKMVPDDAKILVNITQNKTLIAINVVGEVVEPGTYSLPNLTNAISALYAAKGITDLGSVRNIYVKRAGKTIKVIDLYAYLIDGKVEQVYLKNDDYIFVPMQGDIVQATTGVMRRKRYEIKEGETVRDLIRFAGGLRHDALRKNAQIERLDIQKGEDVLIDFDIDAQGSSLKLQDKDVLTIREAKHKAESIVQIGGAVKYPGSYSWSKGKHLSDLLSIVGGLNDNAYLPRAYVVRVAEPFKLSYIPLDLTNFKKGCPADIELNFLDDVIIFDKFTFAPRKFINVYGYVTRPGRFEVQPDLKLKDILYLCGGPKPDADFTSVEFSYIEGDTRELINVEQRDNGVFLVNGQVYKDKSISAVVDSVLYFSAPRERKITRRIEINPDWKNDLSLDTMSLGKYTYIEIFSKYRFINDYTVTIEGAVMNTKTFSAKSGMSLRDAIYSAGGIKGDISVDYIDLFLRYKDDEKGFYGLKTDKKEITRIKLSSDWRNNPKYDSIKIAPYAHIVVHGPNEYMQGGKITVKGMVGNPGEFAYSPKMTLKDAIHMAKGIPLEADNQRIEVSRVLDVENTNGEIVPLQTTIKTFSTSQNWLDDDRLNGFQLLPYDQIFVRPNPDFQLQQSVFVNGEVRVPGEYNKKEKNERLSQLVIRSGGLTKLAFAEGATLNRVGYGEVVIRLDKALEKPGSKYDLILKEGDRLEIPEIKEIVTVNGNVFKSGSNIMFDPAHKRLKYYVDLSGDFLPKTRKNHITITYPNGRVKKVKRFMFIRNYPPVTQGAVVEVPARESKDLGLGDLSKGKPLKDIIAEATATLSSVLTLLVLVRVATR